MPLWHRSDQVSAMPSTRQPMIAAGLAPRHELGQSDAAAGWSGQRQHRSGRRPGAGAACSTPDGCPAHAKANSVRTQTLKRARLASAAAPRVTPVRSRPEPGGANRPRAAAPVWVQKPPTPPGGKEPAPPCGKQKRCGVALAAGPRGVGRAPFVGTQRPNLGGWCRQRWRARPWAPLALAGRPLTKRLVGAM
jgi:hypothetical protein